MKPFLCTIGVILVVLALSVVHGQTLTEPETGSRADVVTLNDGSRIYGDVIDMIAGKLKVRVSFAPDAITFNWADVEKLTTGKPVTVSFKDGTKLLGTALDSPPGKLLLKVDPLAGPLEISMESVAAINPPRDFTYKGTLSFGGSAMGGNASLRQASFLGDFESRTEKQRLTINVRYIYGDDGGRLQARNARGTTKLDFFITKRLYWFASAYFEQDTFQDMKLRTAVASGPGYQVIDKGDYKSPYLAGMTLYVEAGLGYFNEDFRTAEDKTNTTGRWSIKLDWPVLPHKLILYYYQEFFPGLDKLSNFYFASDQGVRITLFGNLVSNFQVTWRYDNTPAPGLDRSDTIYLLTLGYSFSG